MPAPYEETAAAPADSAAISHLPNTPVGKGRKAEADGNVLTSDDVVELTNFIKSKVNIIRMWEGAREERTDLRRVARECDGH